MHSCDEQPLVNSLVHDVLSCLSSLFSVHIKSEPGIRSQRLNFWELNDVAPYEDCLSFGLNSVTRMSGRVPNERDRLHPRRDFLLPFEEPNTTLVGRD
jgi:hypothetical protein